MSADWTGVEEARAGWRQADRAIAPLRTVHAELDDLHRALVRGRYGMADAGGVTDALDNLERQLPPPAFFTEGVFDYGRTLREEFQEGRAVTPDADAVAAELSTAAAGDIGPLADAVRSVVTPPEGPAGIDTTTLEQVRALFGLAVEAAIAAREDRATELQTELELSYDGREDPLPELDEQPIALFPVRLETRFVDDELSTEGDPTQLLVRVYPDQFQVDSHEPELTADEQRWAQTFWATLWYAHHPVPAIPDSPDAAYLQDALPAAHAREHVADIDAGGFSESADERYRELKERAWTKLVDRFGRERAAYLVHALEPTDDDLARRLLMTPGAWAAHEASDESTGGESASDGQASGEQTGEARGETGFADALDGFDPDTLDESGVGVAAAVAEKTRLPALSVPTVARKPESWTRQPRADVMPDRWIAIAEWQTRWPDYAGDEVSHERIAVAGEPIREPLAVGPSPESVAEDSLADEQSESPAPPGTEWMVDFERAELVGMGLRIRLSELSGFDPERGFERLTVVGVQGSTDPAAGADAVRDLLDAHHYTDGLECLPQGTPTNRSADTGGPGGGEEVAPGVDVECVPPLVETGDRSDGDLLARALGISPSQLGDGVGSSRRWTPVEDRHVLANVANADGTEQRDARHMNSALWPATMGYYLQHIGVDNSLAGNPSAWADRAYPGVDVPEETTLREHMLKLGAYRRHFVRYVRARGPFPALRVGDQPYGVLPARAVETERDLSVIDYDVAAEIRPGATLDTLDEPTDVAALVDSGIDPATLVEAGADPGEVLDAGADPDALVAGGVDPAGRVSPADLAPDAAVQDTIGLTRTARLTEDRLEDAGIPVADLQAADIDLRDLARGNVTDEGLSEAGVTTEALAEVLLPPRAQSLGLTPAALERAGVTPGALLRGELGPEDVRNLDISTAAAAEMVLPRDARETGITPRALAEAGVSPAAVLNGEVSATDLERAGITPEAVAELVVPAELRAAGVTPERVGEAVDAATLFNGGLEPRDLERAGISTDALVGTLLPDSLERAGVTADALERADITPAAVLNGAVTPADFAAAGVTPETLADAGLLPDALAEVGSALAPMLDSGLAPSELLDRGLSPSRLLDIGLAPDLLVEAGVAPRELVEAGAHVAQLAAEGALSPAELLSAGASPDQLARVGTAVEAVAGGNVPAEALVRAGFEAVELLDAGADALGVAQGGARPSTLRSAGVETGTLRDAGKSAGALRRAGYDAAELLDGGYTPEELLNGGFQPADLDAAGADTAAVESAGRPARELLAAGYPPADLRANGYGPGQLIEGGADPATLVDAGYSAGELVDAGVDPAELVDAGVDPSRLRAAEVDVRTLADAGADPERLAAAGADPETLLDVGFSPGDLLKAGIDRVELEIAGVDVDALATEAVSEEESVSTDDLTDAALNAAQFAATVLESPAQAKRDLYSFSFDPVDPERVTDTALDAAGDELRGSDGMPAEESGDEMPDERSGDKLPDGGAGAVPVTRPLAMDDKLRPHLETLVAGFGEGFENTLLAHQDFAASKYTAAGDDRDFYSLEESHLVSALKRSAVSQSVRQKTWVYGAEPDAGNDIVTETVRLFGKGTGVAAEKRVEPTSYLLRSVGLRRLDPRLSHLKMLPSEGYSHQAKEAIGEAGPAHFPFVHTNKHRSDISKSQVVERGVGDFVDLLLDADVGDFVDLSVPLDVSSIEPSDEFASEVGWDTLDESERVTAILDRLDEADDPVAVGAELIDEGETAKTDSGLRTMVRGGVLASNADTYDDTGYLHSLLRLLLAVSTLQAYVTARRRLGVAHGDPPDGIPEPTDGSAYPAESLSDETPPAVEAHPSVNRDDDAAYSYFEALHEATKPNDESAAIEPRMHEFADSLRYLGTLTDETRSLLARETLDICSHRLDAWWTSLATRRLFELRETQGSWTGDALDPGTWGTASEIPRATLDPGLLGQVDLSDTVDPVGPDADPQFDPATLDAGLDGVTGKASGDSTSAGGVDPGSGIGPIDPAGDTDGANTGETEQGNGGAGDRSTDGGTRDGTTDGNGTMTVEELVGSGEAATREQSLDAASVSETADADPGLYVGGYGYVEDLRVDRGETDSPEYIHAPSRQQATTAALLRSGFEAHEQTEGENALSVNLGPWQVRAGMELLRGVRRGQSLGELLGHRFERRLRQQTLLADENLMQYLDDFRAAFPATAESLDRPDSTGNTRDEDLAIREVVDGRALARNWDEYPFGRDGLPDEGSAAYHQFAELVADLRDSLRAAGDLLTAESVHQFAQGNFERAGTSLDALAAGAQLPDPEVVQTPRAATGLTHRGCLLLDETAASDAPPRTLAEPALSSWVEGLLPPGDEVECLATYRWGGEHREQTAETTATLADLELAPLDILFLFGADEQPARSEIEQRLVYSLIRDRPDRVPADAQVELELGAAASADAVPMARLLEIARSIREFVGNSRPLTGADLVHPTDDADDGRDAQTARTLTERANRAQDALLEVAVAIDDRLAVLDYDHERGDAVESLLEQAPSETGPTQAPDIGMRPLLDIEAPTSWDLLADTVTLPGGSPVAETEDDLDILGDGKTVTDEIEAVSAAIADTAAAVPLDDADVAAEDIDASALRAELAALAESLPAGPTDPDRVDADLTVTAGEATVSGTLGDVPAATVADPAMVPTTPRPDEPIAPVTDLRPADSASDDRLPRVRPGRHDTSLPGQVGSFDPEGIDIVRPAEPDLTGNLPEEVTVRVWGTDGVATVDVERTVQPALDGRFETTVDLGALDAGTVVSVVATDGERVVYSGKGLVVERDEHERDAGEESEHTDPQSVLAQSPTIQRLAWLSEHREAFTAGALDDLDGAIARTDWQAVRRERDAADPAATTVTDDDLAAIDAVLSLAGTDPGELGRALDAVLAPLHRLGVADLLTVTGDAGPEGSDYWCSTPPAARDARARIKRVLSNPAAYEAGVPPWCLSYAHGAAITLGTLPNGERLSAYLDAFLAAPPWLVAVLDDELADPADTLAALSGWLYDPDTERGDLAPRLDRLADAVAGLSELAVLFEGLPTAEGADRLETFHDDLRALADELASEDSPTDEEATTAGTGVPDAEETSRQFDEGVRAAVSRLQGELETVATAVESAAGTDVDERFRNLVLERLRAPMTVAAQYGVYGGTPQHPDGGSADDAEVLLEQGRALLERLRPRLVDAMALDPRVEETLASRPTATRIDEQIDRLHALFGEEFTVLPPFEPANGRELAATFADDDLVPGDRNLAAETLLQRAARFRDRLDSYRETRTYAEALGGTVADQLRVGQVPHEPGDTWVGVDGVDPEGGKLSLLAQFGPDATPASTETRVAGLFVDEWTESVPAASETTGVALNYDDPGSRPPQTVLVATPPEDGDWTLDDLAATVDETAEYAKRRALDIGDLDESFFKLFPALFFPDYDTDEPKNPPPGTVSFEQIQQYSRTGAEELVELFEEDEQ
jgi:hypothetical protein